MSDLIAEYRKLHTTAQKKQFWRQNPLHGEVEIRVPGLPPFKMWGGDNDDTVVKELCWTGFTGWELTSLMLWHELALQARGGVVLDVGTYSGVYSLIAARTCGDCEVYAFDIQGKCIERVKRNAALNGANISTHLVACLDQPGEVDFYFYEEEDVLSSVASVIPAKINTQKSVVPATPLDQLLASQSRPVKLVKIDVEGAEQRTLKGFARTIERDRPELIIEVNSPAALGKVKRLLPAAYSCYSINELAPQLKKMTLFSRPFKGARNYLFTAKSSSAVKALLKQTKIPAQSTTSSLSA